MVYRPNIQEDLCFVLQPLSKPYIGYFEHIIFPACAEAGLTAVKADDIYGTRAVIQDIWDHIWKSKVIIAIVSGRNPNVNYELGICHTLGIPTVLLTDSSDDVPFDYRHRRYIRYESMEAGWESRLREQLVKTLKAAIDPAAVKDDALPWPYNTERLVKTGKLEEFVDESMTRAEVLKGVDTVRSLIVKAIGPEGRGISQKTTFGNPVIVRSGFQMLGSLSSSNVLQNEGIDAIKRLSKDVMDRAGDYTKTSILIAIALIQLAERELEAGKNLNQLTAGMEEAVEVAAAHLRTQAIPIDDADLLPIALAASRNREIAKLVVAAMQKAGNDGVVQLEVTGDESHSIDFIQGMHFTAGFSHPGFVTDSITKECELVNCRVLLFEQRITSIRDLLPILEQLAKINAPLLIISNEVEGDALATLLLNVKNKTISLVAVRAPGFGDRRRYSMEDIAVYTGANAIFQESGRLLSQITLDDLGHAARVIVTSTTTTIAGGGGDPESVAARIRSIREDIARTRSSFDAEKLRERLARLASGIATIKIGGYTDSDKAEARYSAESALHSCAIALERGCTVGAGTAFLRARKLVKIMAHTNDAQGAGIRIVYEALAEPAIAILATANISDIEGHLKKLENSSEPMTVFDIKTRELSDARVAGVLDASDSLRVAMNLAMAHCKSVLHASAWTTSMDNFAASPPLRSSEIEEF